MVRMAFDPMGSPLVIAHRGASAARQENTIGAFELAATLGCDYIELDVRLTLDRAIVTSHEAVLADGTVICETPEAKLPQWLPTLRAGLAARGSSIVNIEIKNSPLDPDHDKQRTMVEPIARLIEDLDLGAKVLISSFDPGVLAELKNIAPEMARAQLINSQQYEKGRLVEIAELGAIAVHPSNSLVDEQFVAEAHELGLAVNVWTVNDPDRQLELYDCGVNAIFTDAPGELLSLVGRRLLATATLELLDGVQS